VHDRGALGQVGAQAHVRGIADAHPRGQDVVGHARELVHAEDLQYLALSAQSGADVGDVLHADRTAAGPGVVRQLAENAVEVDPVGTDQAVTEQVQAQVSPILRKAVLKLWNTPL